MNIVKKIISLFSQKDTKEFDLKRKMSIEMAKDKRKEAESRINNMIAQINGCGDRWFLQPMKSVDECNEKVNGER